MNGGTGNLLGANITEGHYAASKADFINKYVIAEKEAAETLYWLRLLIKSNYLESVPAAQSLMDDCDELIRLLAASVKTARSGRTLSEAQDLHSFIHRS